MSPLRWPLWLQLTVGFLLVVVLALGGGGYLLLHQMEERQLADRARTLNRQATAGANLVAELSSRGEPLALPLFRFNQQVGVRIIAVSEVGAVQADSANVVAPGTRLTHPELGSALRGESAHGTRWLGDEGGWVMYSAAPVYVGERLVGAVLLAADINAIDASLASIRVLLYYTAAGSLVVALILGVGLAQALTRPLAGLSRAARGLAAGDLKTRVNPGGSREVADLGHHFNTMAVELSRLDRQRRAFVADASHELRTPIASVRALAEGLLRSQGALGDYREYLEDIANECDRASRLVNRLLDLARLDMWQEQRARLTAQFERLDLRDVVGEVVHALEPVAQERQVELHWAPPAEPVVVNSDSRLVETVVGNLVENGLKYTPAGGRVEVAMERTEAEVRIRVADTGPGIPAEHLPHIFERFYRVDKARARRTGGAGLGLAIAQEAASLLEGRLSVKSEEGKGSWFRLDLPYR